MIERLLNFSAGPAVLPEPVLKQAQRDLWSLGGSGIGICEHSHRGPEFAAVIDGARSGIRKLACIPEDYEILFLQGGASSQFFMVPMNLLSDGDRADYIVTGQWSKKAVTEAKRFGDIHVASTSEADEFRNIPREHSFSGSSTYVHFTSNNTVAGTQFQTPPQPPSGVELICDASSDIFSRPIDVSRYGLIYAGAQKNLGPSGLTLVIIKKSLIESSDHELPTMLQYRTHATKGSMFNTPPTFAIYMLDKVIEWILDFGGLEAMGQHNDQKAQELYDYLDESRLFSAHAALGSRSRMNIVFRGKNPEIEVRLIEEAQRRGLSGLKGHRSVGGLRASIYNAFPRAGVLRLIDLMKEFEAENG